MANEAANALSWSGFWMTQGSASVPEPLSKKSSTGASGWTKTSAPSTVLPSRASQPYHAAGRMAMSMSVVKSMSSLVRNLSVAARPSAVRPWFMVSTKAALEVSTPATLFVSPLTRSPMAVALPDVPLTDTVALLL